MIIIYYYCQLIWLYDKNIKFNQLINEFALMQYNLSIEFQTNRL